MIPAQLSSGFRHLFRNPMFTVISMAGLVIGMSSAIIIFLWTATELTYDKQSPENDKVFSVMMREYRDDGQVEVVGDTHGPFADYLAHSVPGIKTVCRTGYRETILLSFGNTHVYGEGRAADSSYFNVFTYEILAGDENRLLPDNNSIVISQTLAAKLFGSTPPIGQVIRADASIDLTVTGVFKYPLFNSSVQVEYIMPLFYHARQEGMTWEYPTVNTYVKLNDVGAKDDVEKNIENKVNELRGGKEYKAFLFAMTDWWLHWEEVELGRSTGRLHVVIAFAIVGGFILLMACINFMNLATARAATRAKEIGVRKMSGASRQALVRQFMMESLVITAMSGVVSVLFVYLLLPVFNLVTGSRIIFGMTDPFAIGVMMLVVGVTAVLSGAYPAFLLSSLSPAKVLKGNFTASKGTGVRRHLVVFQFTISVIMIFCAFIVYKQIGFLREMDQGYDKNNVLFLSPDADFPISAFKTEALRSPAVEIIGEAAAAPMEINGVGELTWKVNGHTQTALFNNNPCDHNYIPTMGMTLVAGRNFSEAFASDSAAFIITRRGADLLGFNDAVGQVVKFSGQEGKIIGVVEDFQNSYMNEPTSPVIFQLGDDQSLGRWRSIYIRYRPGTLNEALSHLEAIFTRLYPNHPFVYNFLDTYFQDQFWRDEIIGNLSLAFMVISISLACLGLFGLTLFSTQRRTREIGIRKVLGASVVQLMVMLCREFSRPIVISIIISLPIGFYIMQRFLESYLVRTTIGLDVFVGTVVLIALVGLLTVSFQAFSAANRNPVEALKTE